MLRLIAPSLRFETFSGKVRKLRVCRGDVARPIGTENAQIVRRWVSRLSQLTL